MTASAGKIGLRRAAPLMCLMRLTLKRADNAGVTEIPVHVGPFRSERLPAVPRHRPGTADREGGQHRERTAGRRGWGGR